MCSPFVSFDSINMDGSRLWNVQSFMAFERDFNAKRVPQFVFMSPNMMNDGHNTSLGFTSSWAHNFVNRLIDEDAFDEKTLIMLTFDESEDATKPNQIVTILLGSAVPQGLRGTTDETFYTHYSILSSMEYNWNLPNLGRYDVGANVFNAMVTRMSPYQNHNPWNGHSVDNSISYPGPLNDEDGKQLPYPVPNQYLTGAGGMPILESIRRTWAAQADEPTPYNGSGNVHDGNQNLPVAKPPVKPIKRSR
jgi:hypothetical protein